MRRAHGTGGISKNAQGQFVAIVTLRGGKRKTRRRWTREDAETALQELLEQFDDQLGYFYHYPPRFRPGAFKRRRSNLSVKDRFKAFERDGFRCVYCGNTPAEARLVIDHAISILDGGTNDLDNLVTACLPCNAGKGSRSIARAIPEPAEAVEA